MSPQTDRLQPFRFIRCIVAGDEFCIRMSWVRRIRDAFHSEYNSSLGIDDQFNGLSTDIDNCLVVKLDGILNYPDDESIQRKVLVLRLDDGYFGILVDTVEDIFEVSSDQIFDIPAMVGAEALKYFDEVVYYKNKLVLSFSPLSIYSFLSLEPNIASMSIDDNSRGFYQTNLSIAHHRQKKIVIFTPGSQGEILYGLSITQIPQILQLSSILSIPGSLDYISGLIEWRGIILPVIDISLCIEKKKTDINGDCRIIVVRLVSKPIYIAVVIQSHILIQSFPILQRLDEQDLVFDKGSVIKQFQFQDKILVIPNVDSIVSVDENVVF